MKIWVDSVFFLLRKFRFFLFVILVVYLLSDSVERNLSIYQAYHCRLSKTYLQKNDFEKLTDSQEWFKTVQYAKEKTDPNAIFLLFRSAEFPLYANRKFITSLDPMLLQAYKATSDQALYERLQDLNISYIYVPGNYTLAVLSNTQFAHFIPNPTYTELLADHRGYRLYKVKQHPDNKTTYSIGYQELAKKASFVYGTHTYKIYQTRFYSPKIDINNSITYQLVSHFSGEGYLRIFANESDKNGREFSSRMLCSHRISKEHNETFINKTFYAPSQRAKKVKFVYVPAKDTDISVLDTKVYTAKKVYVPIPPEDIALQNRIGAFAKAKIKVKPDAKYYIKSDIIGDGFLALYAYEYNASGQNIGISYLNSIMCYGALKSFSAIYIPPKGTDYFKLFYRKTSRSKFGIYRHRIFEVTRKREENVKP